MVDGGCNILMQMSRKNAASFLFQLRRGQFHPLMLNLHFSVSCQHQHMLGNSMNIKYVGTIEVI